MLAARTRGLGTCWTTFHLAHEEEAAELLGIPYAEVMQVALIPVAYTIGTEFRPARRKPLDDDGALGRLVDTPGIDLLSGQSGRSYWAGRSQSHGEERVLHRRARRVVVGEPGEVGRRLPAAAARA